MSTIIPYFDPILGKLRNSDVALISVASLIVTDPLIVNNLIVNTNASINTLYGNTINASTVSTNTLISNNIANHSTVSTNLLSANGVTASLVSATEIHTQKLFASTATLGLTHISTIDWNLTSGATALVEGQMNWDANQQTAVIGMAGGNVDLALGMETLFPRRVKNSTATTMPKGSVVYINGVSGNDPTVDFAIATGDMTSAFTLGMTAEDITAGQKGWVATFGELTGIDLSSFTGGDTLYLSGATAGLFTNTPQLAPYHYVRVGTVVKATPDGALVVNVINGYELDEMHNVAISSLASGQILQSGASSLWYNRSLASAVADLNVLASLGSLAYQNTVDYVTQVTSKPSLGSLAPLNSLTQEYLPSSASFTNLYTTGIQTGGLAVTSTASVRNLNVTNILAGNASISGALNVGNIFGLNFLGVASTILVDTLIGTNVLSTDVSNTSNISTNTLYANIVSAGTYLNLPSLGSLAQQNTVDYTQITNFPSLGSMAIISDVEAPLNLSGVTLSLSIASISHNSLGDLTTSDPHTQYVYWAGRNGGQLITGGTANNNALSFRANTGTSNTLSATAFEWLAGNSGNNQRMVLQQDGALGVNTSVSTARFQLANGVTSVSGYNNAFQLSHSINKTTGDFIGAFFYVNDVAGGAGKTIYSHRAKVEYNAFPAATLAGMQATSNQMVISGGNRVNYAEVLTSNFEVFDTSIVDEARLIRLFAPNIASTASVSLLIGLDIPNITGAVTNWSIYSAGGKMYHKGNVGIGVSPAASRALSIGDDNAATLSYVALYEGATQRYSFGTEGGEFNIFDDSAAAYRITLEASGEVGIGTRNPTARLDVEQTSATAAIPTLELTQSDLSEEFINFVSTTGTTNSLSTAALGTYFGKARVGFNGVLKWIAIYN